MFALDKFSKTDLLKRLYFQDEYNDVPHARFSYESRSRIYDVDIRKSDGQRTYHVNGSFAVPPQDAHRAIEKHFSLGPTPPGCEGA